MFRDGDYPRCPACVDAALEIYRYGGVERLSCAGCGGAWVDDAVLRQIVEDLGGAPDEPLGELVEPASPRACLRCGAPMVAEALYGYQPTIHVDICPDHGAWFDRDELAEAIARVGSEIASRKQLGLRSHSLAEAVAMNLVAPATILIDWLRRRWKRTDRRRGRPEDD